MSSVTCPNCSHRFHTPPDAVGSNAECSKCGQSFVLSLPSPLSTPPEPELVLYPVAEPILTDWTPNKVAAWIILGGVALGTLVMIILGCLGL